MPFRPLISLIAIATMTTAALAHEPKFQSKVLRTSTKGHAVDIDIDITGAKELYLIALDGDGEITADWADWAEPRLIGPNGEKKLTELTWKSANTEFGQVSVNRNANGDPLRIDGVSVPYGIGTHANSAIAYDLPAGFTRFKTRAGIDNGGSEQGSASSIQFLVFTEPPSEKYTQRGIAQRADVHEAKNAVAGLDVADGLEVTLFASEASGMLSPADIDIDHLGRVWVCEVVNYRHRSGERKEGDRILIIEDTDGDGISDRQSTFYQGPEVDSALGICVLPTLSGRGTKAIISCAPNVWIFTDEDGDLKADKKELLFTNAGRPQHDHSTHAAVFGPDGKLYWNFGNTGEKVCDKVGKPIIDVAGHDVIANGKPYRQGMAFRCNLDGKEFEVLGHNFRNNYELSVDSFGTVWQSDNDDDGNKGVRINYVMEGGNFGYTDEMTGAGWQTPRTNLEAEIPLRHWHLNDPGVVPNLVQTGAGSPTGICFYEGMLLPELFRNQIIHCDAGPNVVRSYPATKSGAGYKAEIVDLLAGTRDNWFRPSDVCVAPDGSLIVADWYDPGVGGHRMGDVDKGRLFRIAPPKTAYKTPRVDVSTIEGAIAALKSPNLATRYIGWTALHTMKGPQVTTSLQKVLEADSSPQVRARALGVLAKSPATRNNALDAAMRDKNSDVRIAGLRLARQKLPDESQAVHTSDLVKRLETLIDDAAIEVRRECALALRLLKHPRKQALWAKLAVQHEGSDRWYLEALGIGADHDWDACLAAALELAGHPSDHDLADNAIARDIFWRSRASTTPQKLATILASDQVAAIDAPRYLRSFDFVTSPTKEAALVELAFGKFGSDAKTMLINSEAISRLDGFDITKNPVHQVAMDRILNGLQGQPQFVTLIDKFNVVNRFPDLLTLAQVKPDEQLSIDAIRVLLGKKQTALLNAALATTKGTSALATATALSNSGDARAAELLLPIALSESLPLDLRREAIKGAARSKAGVLELVKLAESQKTDESLAPALSAAFYGSSVEDARLAAAKLFPLPPGKDSKPLPPLTELAQMKGNLNNGQKLFASIGKCNTCHIVNDAGKEVGPNLSEIGAKLSRQAMFESIVFPSAGISHNYESSILALKDGTTQTGIITSEDPDSISIKGIDAIVRRIPRDEIEERVKQKISLMPADLPKILSQEELADIVEYLTTLKKSKK
ncbi:PVC-type heme-binding CxxCH protein [Schlesneria paludicola]|uniref:PVC-type heme-binding CxxCH protein n=1 Tax=Schlesneria paludicola TaxID=360056 RepID=UPI00029AE2E2|nr:PVC-type heme-binding CxxCH protein [Schlesneria paludicola]